MRAILFLLLFVSVGCIITGETHDKATTAKEITDSAYTYRVASGDGIGKFYFGREIAKVMGAAGSDWLERDTRNQEENTRLAIEKIDVVSNSVIADIGAGTGYYSFKLAAKVPAGKVYAVEIQDELIDYLKNKKTSLRDSVVEIIKGTDQSLNLPDASVDIALLVDVYHELAYPKEMIQSISRALKPSGKILLIEYRGEDPAVPIKKLHKTTVAQLSIEFAANGFQLKTKGDFLPIQHFLVYEKKQ